jgi:predicted lipid-binding transport protein (Tim44 family)
VALIDIIVLVVVLALVVSRFTGFKLPTDTRDAATRKAELEKMFGRRKVAKEAYGPNEPATEAPQPVKKARALGTRDVAHLAGLEQIRALDAGFDTAAFMDGATAAYSYYYDCYNARDREGIINLCGPQLEEQVLAEWQSNPGAIALEGAPEATLVNARLNGRTAIIELEMRATQRAGKAAPKAVTARWVFARALASPDPNWEVQSITPQADA